MAVEEIDYLDEVIEKFSLWKALRVCTWVKRFMMNCRNSFGKVHGPLNTKELENQRQFWIKRVQATWEDKDLIAPIAVKYTTQRTGHLRV